MMASAVREPRPLILFREADSPEFEPVSSSHHLRELLAEMKDRMVFCSTVRGHDLRRAIVSANDAGMLSIELALHKHGEFVTVSETQHDCQSAVDQVMVFFAGLRDLDDLDEEEPDPTDEVTYTGAIVLHTLSGSRYLVDLDMMTLLRLRDGTVKEFDELPASIALRRDGETLKILQIHQLRIGVPAVFDLEPLGNPRYVAFTRRATTAVLAIEPAGVPE